MVVKGIDFTGDSKFLVAGTPESNFDLLQNLRPEGTKEIRKENF